ncbi:unnamed protein product [Cyprideis torosa]|uniref:Uncharacterized protein n=1 Tax=Cyprideis torosa TaxID=163714 RepID=A0A7R8WW62_9CRUS|nr:unnamed protein product [Cyprideis torosa]CAG0908152.1 unnamed protein product [Cyprideis torosa]
MRLSSSNSPPGRSLPPILQSFLQNSSMFLPSAFGYSTQLPGVVRSRYSFCMPKLHRDLPEIH